MSKATEYDLFNDVEDSELRAHNRAAVMGNILDDGGMTMEAVGNAMKYLRAIPQPERMVVVERIAERLGAQV
jgi:hypothetical protein